MINMEFERKLEHIQRIDDQRKLDKRRGLPPKQLTDTELIILRAQRQERLEGVTFYVPTAFRDHNGKKFKPDDLDGYI